MCLASGERAWADLNFRLQVHGGSQVQAVPLATGHGDGKRQQSLHGIGPVTPDRELQRSN